MTYAPVDAPFLAQALLDFGLEVGSGFDPSWALGPGIELGFELSTRDDRWKTMGRVRASHFVAGDTETHLQADLSLRRTLTRTTAAIAELKGHDFDSESWLEARLSFQWTF